MGQVIKLYKEIKERKKLLSEHTHFACDTRVMTQLYNLLGKTFGARNNFPVPIDFEKPTKLHQALQLSVDSAYMHLKVHFMSLILLCTEDVP